MISGWRRHCERRDDLHPLSWVGQSHAFHLDPIESTINRQRRCAIEVDDDISRFCLIGAYVESDGACAGYWCRFDKQDVDSSGLFDKINLFLFFFELLTMIRTTVSIHLHRSLFTGGLCLLHSIPSLFSRQQRSTAKIAQFSDENIDLIDLSDKLFRLIPRAGQSIRLLKTSKTNWNKIPKKKAFQSLPSEPVTLADLLSLTILSRGLKKTFSDLPVQVSRTISKKKTNDGQSRSSPTRKHRRWWTDPILEKAIRSGQFQKQQSPSDRHRTASYECPIVCRCCLDPSFGSYERIHRFISYRLASLIRSSHSLLANLLQYVIVMLTVNADQQPRIGILYASFIDKTRVGYSSSFSSWNDQYIDQ